MQPTTEARRWIVAGRVQGVGYRPFVFRLARRLELRGSVRNLTGQVLIEAAGPPSRLDAFSRALVAECPPLARPKVLQVETIAGIDAERFEIAPSLATPQSRVHVPPDSDLCEDCRRELQTPGDRRYRYPFINCTQCGPRYTLVTGMPYDRANTTMAGFELCPRCRAEYEDPANRRFHAEPVACPDCGPRLTFAGPGRQICGHSALDAAIRALRQGQTVAVKGIGGYHLLCDASDPSAIARLRSRKLRPHKPLALLFPWAGSDGLDAVRGELQVDDAAGQQLLAVPRPIVLLRRRPDSQLPDGIAPGLREIGAMLPYSPLHHLLLDALGSPVVATSANVSGEPVLTDNTQVEARLGQVAHAFLHHDRPIARPADDSVVRLVAGKPRVIRVGRGFAPLELELPAPLPRPLLAVGGHTKNAVAFGWDRRLVLSPHIGDLDSARSLEVFEQVIGDLKRLYGVVPEAVVCDAHSRYASSRWAAQAGLPLVRVWHHRAHASALALEQGPAQRWLVFAWDGVGLGEDGTLWGGETFLGSIGAWRRTGRLRPFRLQGGERAAREVWRSGASLCWETGLEYPFVLEQGDLLRESWKRSLNAATTTAAGRLFDGAANLVGLLACATHEGQAGMQLEQVADGSAGPIPLPLQQDADGLVTTDWAPLVQALADRGTPAATRAMQFHQSLACAIVDQATCFRERDAFERVGLTGGVFQNKLLSELATSALEAAGFEVRLPERVPCNDGGIAVGQLAEAGYGHG